MTNQEMLEAMADMVDAKISAAVGTPTATNTANSEATLITKKNGTQFYVGPKGDRQDPKLTLVGNDATVKFKISPLMYKQNIDKDSGKLKSPVHAYLADYVTIDGHEFKITVMAITPL